MQPTFRTESVETSSGSHITVQDNSTGEHDKVLCSKYSPHILVVQPELVIFISLDTNLPSVTTQDIALDEIEKPPEEQTPNNNIGQDSHSSAQNQNTNLSSEPTNQIHEHQEYVDTTSDDDYYVIENAIPAPPPPNPILNETPIVNCDGDVELPEDILAHIMLRLKIDPNLVGFSFWEKSLLTLWVVIGVFVISGNGYHPRWPTIW